MVFNSLYSKIALVLTATFLLIGLLFIWVTAFATDMYQREVNQKLHRDLARQIVTQRHLMKEGRVDHQALADLFYMFMVINPAIEIYFLDPQGDIITGPPGKARTQKSKIDLIPIRQFLDKTAPLPILGTDPRSPNGKKAFSAAPIYQDGELGGYLYVILGGEAYDSVAEKIKGSYILQISALMVGTGLLFALMVGLILFGLLTRRLRRLTNTMENFKQTNPLVPTTAKRFPDEIDRLTTSFNALTQRIEKQMHSLRESDNIRRELVANVSHDLRTPLATLQGYIETLLINEAHAGPDERKKYLEIAIRHCRRLNRLVDGLLELARLESAQISVHPEPFNLAELVQDVTANFMLMAQKKEIHISTEFDDSIPFALADIGLVERVLENLMENAISHTPDGGQVNIHLSAPRDILVRVQDSGPGIPESQQKNIFNRFYHGRDMNKAHLGLGLAISQKILHLHQGEITLESLPQQGSCFSFILPRAPL